MVTPILLRSPRAIAPPLLAIAAELLHPTWTSGTAYEALAGRTVQWLAVHAALIVLFALLARSLAVHLPPGARSARLLLGVLVVANLTYLALDGLGIGLLVARANQLSGAALVESAQSVEALWTSPLTILLADLAGITWMLGLLACAASLHPVARSRLALAGWIATVFLVLASVVLPGAGQIARLLAITIGAVLTYQAGAAAIPSALLAIAAVLPQHVGAQAQLGLLCVFLALIGWTQRGTSMGRV